MQELLLPVVAVLAGVAVFLLALMIRRRGEEAKGIARIEARLAASEAFAQQTDRSVREQLAIARSETAAQAAALRAELGKIAAEAGSLQMQQHERSRGMLEERLTALQAETSARLLETRQETTAGADRLREQMTTQLTGLIDSVARRFNEAGTLQQTHWDAFAAQMKSLSDATERKLETLRAAVDTQLRAISEQSAKQLEQMRQTVDEKLQGTLDARLGASFNLVSERLELVHKGLGEMQALAAGVGDLKRVFVDVKARGTWGEVQLKSLLEQMLVGNQYEENVQTRPGGRERVEFAIRLPGNDSRERVWLPIDSKFPLEKYSRLVDAAERGDREAAEAAGKELEAQVKLSAKDIRDKYIEPPHTTDFGVLFVPVEGLYAEILRRRGLVEQLQREHRIVLAGPTTLCALLNSLQMGFRTLAVQKQSSDVWKLLGAVKTDFGKFGDLLQKVRKKLDEASNEIERASERSRQIQRKLVRVQELPARDGPDLLVEGDEAGGGDASPPEEPADPL